MRLLKAYQYFFYKIYKSIEYTSFPKFWSEWKALVIIIAIEIWTLFSLSFYYQSITGESTNNLPWFQNSLWIVSALLAVWNWYLFEHHDKWKDIIKDFDSLSDSQNRKGSIIVTLVVLASIANVIFSIYLLSQAVKNV